MTKQVTYVCDVCGATSERPFKLHLQQTMARKTSMQMFVITHCAIKFAKDAADKAGIKDSQTP